MIVGCSCTAKPSGNESTASSALPTDSRPSSSEQTDGDPVETPPTTGETRPEQTEPSSSAVSTEQTEPPQDSSSPAGFSDPPESRPPVETNPPETNPPEEITLPDSFGLQFDNSKNGIYNYCPSIMQADENTRYIYYCTNSVSYNVTDYIGCRKAERQADGSWVWGEETIVLSPTAGT